MGGACTRGICDRIRLAEVRTISRDFSNLRAIFGGQHYRLVKTAKPSTRPPRGCAPQPAPPPAPCGPRPPDLQLSRCCLR